MKRDIETAKKELITEEYCWTKEMSQQPFKIEKRVNSSRNTTTITFKS